MPRCQGGGALGVARVGGREDRCHRAGDPGRAAGHPPASVSFVETDGWETHRTRAAFQADRRRDAALQADGRRVVRFTWHEPRATIQRRLQALLPG
jgi:hypothetical protein